MMLIKDMLRITAGRVPDKIALIMGEDSVTYKKLNQRVNRLAHGLMEMSLCRGDRVALLTHNSIAYYEIYLALCKIGGVLVPFNNLLKEKELIRDFDYIKPRFIFFEAKFAPVVEKLMQAGSFLEKAVCIDGAVSPAHVALEKLMAGKPETEPEVEVKPEDLMSIFLTSGTTGKPKGVMRTQHHNAFNAMAGAIELGLKPDDRALLLFPFYHVTLEDRFCHILRGNTIVIRREGSFEARQVLDLLATHRITVCQFVPTMINTLLQEKTIDQYDLSALRLILYAAAPMPVSLLKQAMERFGGSGFMQFFGQTETGPLTTLLRPEDHRVESETDQQRLASCGRAAMHFEVKIVDELDLEVPRGQVGELVVRGEAMTAGYWHLPEETAKLLKGGWLHTGDFAKQDEEGFIYIVDRKNDMIISGGKNIYPREVEEVLYSHPAVLETTVIGVPDPHWGESVKAIVVLKQDMTATAGDLIAFCKENMASYKKPSTVEFRDTLPKSPTGKILKRILRDEFWKGHDRKV